MPQREIQGISVVGSGDQWQSTKTEAELRMLFPLIGVELSFEDFPDGVTWADLAAAEALKEKDAS